MLLIQEERYEDAEPLLADALARKEALLGPLKAKVGLAGLAMLKTKQGKPDEALKYLDRLAEIHQHYPADPTDVAYLHSLRATALWEAGQRDTAVKEMLTAIEFIEKQRGFSMGAERERATLMSSFANEFEILVDWQAQLGNTAGMFLAAEGAKARTFLDELRLKQADPSAGLTPEQRTQSRQREDQLRRELAQAEKAFEKLTARDLKPTAEQAAAEEKAAQSVTDARSALYQFLRDVRAASPAYKRLVTNRERPTTLADLQATLSDDELLLEYSIGNWLPSYVLAVRRDSAAVTKIMVDDRAAKTLGIEPGPLKSDALAQLLTDEKTGVLPVLSSAERKEDIREKLAALWAVLVPQAERAALTDGRIKKLVIVPDRALALLPFETLVVAIDPKPEYLLEAGPPISYAPSAAILVNLSQRERGASRAEQRAFTLGDPAYARQPAANPKNDNRSTAARAADQFRSGLTRLPFSGWEAVWVNKNFADVGAKAMKVTGAQATEAAIRQYAPKSEIVHLACHGIVDLGYGNFFGSLAVAPGGKGDPRDDGFLSMSEIYDLDLSNCDLAILSACDTNYGPQQTGEGVWALSRGFLVAGARRVVASNWLVDDEAGATLVHHFTAVLAKSGEDPAARDYATALQAAKRKIHKQEKWAHPFYWSSLVLVGAR